MLIERGHKDVLDYDYDFFYDMLDSTMKIKSFDDKSFAFLVRLGFSDQDINKTIDSIYNGGSIIEEKDIDALNKLQKDLI
ncbi:MAG: hypothetical protein AB7E09_07255 [Candidatus Izemoplasmatales bacterium]